jgi:hypothetical protein
MDAARAVICRDCALPIHTDGVPGSRLSAALRPNDATVIAAAPVPRYAPPVAIHGAPMRLVLAACALIVSTLAAGAAPGTPAPGTSAEVKTEAVGSSAGQAQGPETLPEIQYDPGLLPERVRTMRDRILEAAKSGDPEKLRPVIESNEMPPSFTFGDGEDPIKGLIAMSVDGEGREMLAILAEIMEAGYSHVDVGTPQEMYVWPYFARYPLDKLSPAQLVEVFRIVTAQEYQEMQSFGAYNFYRVGIGTDGTWHFFIAGD